MYDVACRAARADLLLLTESHCLPSPDAALRLIGFFEGQPFRAGWLQSGHISPNWLARMEERLVEEDRRQRPDPDDWRHVSLRGLAIRKSLYLEAGGLPHELGRFSESVLAHRIQQRFGKLVSVPGGLIRHGNCARLSRALHRPPHAAAGQAAYWDRVERRAVESFHPHSGVVRARHASPTGRPRAAAHRDGQFLLRRRAARLAGSLRGGVEASTARFSGGAFRSSGGSLEGARRRGGFAGTVSAHAMERGAPLRELPQALDLTVAVGILEEVCRQTSSQEDGWTESEELSAGRLRDGTWPASTAVRIEPRALPLVLPIALLRFPVAPGRFRIRLRGRSPFSPGDAACGFSGTDGRFGRVTSV